MPGAKLPACEVKNICIIEGVFMKNVKVRWFFCMTVGWALFCAVLSACGGVPAPVSTQTVSPPDERTVSGADELDAAIRAASDYLNGRVPGGSKAVFLNIKSDYPDLSEYLLSALSENAVNDGVFSVVDRQQLDSIRAELNFQLSGEVSDESAQSIGQMLGAQSIVSGAVSKLGSLYRVQVKAIEVQSAGVQGQWSRNVPNGATIAALTEYYVPSIAGGGSAVARPAPARNTSPAPTATAAPASPGTDYKIGQRGPAGGFVFYDNEPAPVSQAVPTTRTYTVGQNGPAGGLTFYDNEPKVILAAAPVNTSVTYKVGDKGPAGGVIFYVNPSATDGWRYLEAAPASTEGKAAWSSAGADVRGTNVDIGTGKQNTQAIVTHSINTGENCRAAMLCDTLTSGGYDDWFLPSKVELNLMFVYLKEAGIGGFKEDWYWSSSVGGRNGGAWTQIFSTGLQDDGPSLHDGSRGNKSYEHLVRAIRQF
jgi:hypothetical protein